MAYNLLSCERDHSYLMPPSMRDWLSEGHLAWFIVDAVGQMDLREFYTAYRSDGWGAAAYDPGMMVAILLYGYCLGVRSSRRIARALDEDVGFRVVAANRQPGHGIGSSWDSASQAGGSRGCVLLRRLWPNAGSGSGD